MNTRSFIFFTRILARAQISSMIFRGLFYWGFIGHNFGDYKNRLLLQKGLHWVLSVTILETTKTSSWYISRSCWFYRSQFWRLQKQARVDQVYEFSFIGHNFGDYKNTTVPSSFFNSVLSVTILETTKTGICAREYREKFYRSQFWRLQKQTRFKLVITFCFIGHNFGDYKNSCRFRRTCYGVLSVTILETTKTDIAGIVKGASVLSVTILETTKTSNGIS